MHSKSVNWHSLCITFNYLMKILRITKARTSTKIQFKHLHAKIQWHFKSVKITFPSNKKKMELIYIIKVNATETSNWERMQC